MPSENKLVDFRTEQDVSCVNEKAKRHAIDKTPEMNRLHYSKDDLRPAEIHNEDIFGKGNTGTKFLMNVEVPLQYTAGRDLNYKRYRAEEWFEKFENSKLEKEDAARRMKQLNEHLKDVVKESERITHENKCDADTKLGEHLTETLDMRCVIENHIDKMKVLLERLRVMIADIDKLLEQMNLTNHVVGTCLHYREKRPFCELVNDKVEDALYAEATNLYEEIAKFFKALEVAKRLYNDTNYTLKKLQKFSFLKFQSQQIDESMRNLNKFSQGAPMYPSNPEVPFPNKTSDWRIEYRDLIDEVTKLEDKDTEYLECAADSMKDTRQRIRDLWMITNKNFDENISNMIVAEKLAVQALEETMGQINEMLDKCDQLDQNIRDKKRALALANHRVHGQERRPGLENNLDPSNESIRNDVLTEKQLIEDVDKEREGVRRVIHELNHVKRDLENRIASRKLAIYIDRIECLQLRQGWHDSPVKRVDLF